MIAWEHPPTLALLRATPSLGERGFAGDGAVELVFSHAIDCSADLMNFIRVTETPEPYDGTAVDIAGTTMLACTDATLRIKPGGPMFSFAPASKVGLTVSTGFPSTQTSSLGGTLPDDVLTEYFIESPPTLFVNHTRPSQGATGADPNPTVAFTFFQDVEGWSLDCSSFVPGVALTDTTSVVVSEKSTGAIEFTAIDPAGLSFDCQGDTYTIQAGTHTFGFLSEVQVDLAQSVASQVRSLDGGTLASDFSLAFTIAESSPLAVTRVSPSDRSVNVAVDSDVELDFNQSIIVSSLCVPRASGHDECAAGDGWPSTFSQDLCCDDGGNYVQRLCIVAEGADADAYRAGDNTKCLEATVTFDADLHRLTASALPLIDGDSYEVIVRGAASPILGVGARPLPEDFQSSFGAGAVHPKVDSIVPDSSEGVPAGTTPCITLVDPLTFDVANVTQAHVEASYVDSLDASRTIAGTIALSDGDRTLCFSPTALQRDCSEDVVSFPHGVAITLKLLDTTPLIDTSDGSSTTLGAGTEVSEGTATLQWTTAEGIAPIEVWASNSVVSDDLADAEADRDVPVNVEFVVRFAESMAAPLDSNFALHRAGDPTQTVGGTADFSRDDAGEIADANVLVFTPTATDRRGALLHGQDYTFIIKSGAVGPQTTLGKQLTGRHHYDLHTSPATYVSVTPPAGVGTEGIQIFANSIISFSFSRPIHAPSFTNAGVYFEESTTADFSSGSVPVAGAYSVDDPTQPEIGMFNPIPGFLASTYVRAYLDEDMLDFRGNPVHTFRAVDNADTVDIADDTITDSDLLAGFDLRWGQTAGFDNKDPTAFAAGSQDPADAATGIAGDAVIGFRFPGSSQTKNLMLPASFRTDPSSAARSTFWIEHPTTGLPVAGSIEFLAGDFEASPRTHGGDVIRFHPDPGSLFDAGATYTVHLDQENVASINNFAPVAAEVTWSFSVESVAPTVSRVCAFDRSTVEVPTSAAVDACVDIQGTAIEADSLLAVVFSETLRPSTAIDDAAPPIVIAHPTNGSVTSSQQLHPQRNDVVLLTPSAYMEQLATGYTLTVAATVADAAGDALGSADLTTFDIAATATSVVASYDMAASGGPDTALACAVDVPVASPLYLQFDRQMTSDSFADGAAVIREGMVDGAGVFSETAAGRACIHEFATTVHGTTVAVTREAGELAATTVHQLMLVAPTDTAGHAIEGIDVGVEFSTASDFGAGVCVP